MIEKVEGYTTDKILAKVNELVDAVNGILDYAPLEMAMKAEPAENRESSKMKQAEKWIGCVCRFWFDNPDDFLLDILGKVQTGKDGIEYYAQECYDWYPHCEPVKPTDSIIYKGGDNE